MVALSLGGMAWQAGARGAERASEAEKARGLSHAFCAAAKKVIPTVVKVKTVTKPHAAPAPRGRAPGESPFRGTPFEDFFDDETPGFRFDGRIPQRQGLGSGVIIDPSGVILTNNQMVEGADEVLVELPDGRQFKAAAAGLREGMIIMRVGKKPVASVADFKAGIKGESLKEGVMLLVRTQEGNRFVVLQQS